MDKLHNLIKEKETIHLKQKLLQYDLNNIITELHNLKQEEQEIDYQIRNESEKIGFDKTNKIMINILGMR